MDGGSVAKNAYRYQDWCAMYFALESFKSDPSFEGVHCEQNKLDFEIWNTLGFAGFQVKTNPAGLTARETNKIFTYYSNKSASSGKQNRSFRFIFTKQPTKCLGHLFTVVREDNRGVRYGRRIQTFINTALQYVPMGSFSIDFLCFNEQEIKHMVFSLSAEILKDKIGEEDDIRTEVVYNFIARFRDEIDKICCNISDTERTYSASEIDTLVSEFIRTFKAERWKREGLEVIRIELPKSSIKSAEIIKKRITIEMESIEIKKENEGGQTIGL